MLGLIIKVFQPRNRSCRYYCLFRGEDDFAYGGLCVACRCIRWDEWSNNVYAVSELCLIITLSLSATEAPKLQFPPAPDPTTFEPTFRFVISINNLDKPSRCDSTLIVDRWIAPVT